MKDINLRADAPNQVSGVNPDQLSKEINTLQDIQQEIFNQEEKLKELKEREKYYSGMIIPDLMQQLNLKTLTLQDGSQIEVKNIFGASIIADKKQEAHNWLRNNGLGAIVKNEITVKFGLNEDNKAEQYATLARGQGYEPDRKVAVHASTLRTTLEDFHTRGGKIPSEFFRTFEGNQTKIKTKK
jgi:hypothetical protein|tara:strand:- start:8088 stop:8639 length:552 start_codon:yes stop_codon:yes gene_type:complete